MIRFQHCAAALLALVLAGTTTMAQPPDRDRGDDARQRGSRSLERLMENDTDGDGRLSREELPERAAERMFDQADANDDGYLDEAELTAFVAARGARGNRRGGPDGAERRGAPRASLRQQMFAAGRAMRSLGDSTFDAASRESDLEHVNAFQAALVGAKGRAARAPMTPAGTAKHGSDPGAYATALRLDLLTALAESMTLERVILAGDADAARASLKRLAEIRNRSHAVFQPEDDDADDADARPERGRRGQRPGRGQASPDRGSDEPDQRD